jgi:hypothetical protein
MDQLIKDSESSPTANVASSSLVVCTGMDLPAGFGRVFMRVRVYLQVLAGFFHRSGCGYVFLDPVNTRTSHTGMAGEPAFHTTIIFSFLFL